MWRTVIKNEMMKKIFHRGFLLAGIFLLAAAALNGQHAACCAAPAAAPDAIVDVGGMKIPNVELLTQDGDTVHFYELIRGKTVAINFVFTTCTTICPPMGANFVRVKQLLENRVGKDLVMLSVSIDPAVDTPERLKAWQAKFSPGAGWTMLTGTKTNVDRLLKALKVYTAVKEDHSPILLVGRDGDDNWIRTNGLAEPEKIAQIIGNYLPATAPEPAAAPAPDGDLAYFTDTKLVDQNGVERRFYSDLLKNKVVVINVFFTECTGTCPLMSASLRQIQDYLGDSLGRQVVILSISVDCTHDTPEQLKAYAERFGAREGWYFLGGPRENVDLVLKKLGQYVETRETHQTVMLIGNIKTRLWKKANGLAPASEIFTVLESVIQDHD